MRNIHRHILWLALVLLCCPQFAYSAQSVVVAFSEFPPYKMMVDGTHKGIDIDILQEIGKQMDFTLKFKNGTFDKCLEMIKQGEADLISSLHRRGEREAFILYVQPRYRTKSNTVFYLLKKNQNSIRTYDDLSTLKIGVKVGAKYALRFDNDNELNKVPAQSIKLNISKLTAGQIDTFISAETEGDYWIQTLGLQDRITKSSLNFQQLDPIYFGISKQSAFKKEAKRFGRILKGLVDKGTVQRIVDKYLK